MMRASVKGCSDLTKKTAPGRSLRRPREPLSVKARDGRLRENRPEDEAHFYQEEIQPPRFDPKDQRQQPNGPDQLWHCAASVYQRAEDGTSFGSLINSFSQGDIP